MAYERNSDTIVNAAPGGDTVRTAIVTRLNEAVDDIYVELNNIDADVAGAVSGAASAVSDAADALALAGTATQAATLAASGGSALVGFLQDGTGAAARTVQAKLRDFVSVKDFGAVGDGVTDDTAAIQAAIDAAQTILGLTGVVQSVYFSSGRYIVTSTIVWKSAPLIGENNPNTGVRIIWGGSSGGTLLQKWSTAHDGINSFGGMRDICLRGDGTNTPAILLDLSAFSIDALFQLHRVHFTTASNVLLKIGTWTNLHWEQLRFDGGGNYAIEANYAGGSLSSFVVDKFTYDNGGVGKGFLRVNNPTGANLGVVALKNARVELASGAGWSNEKALVSIDSGTGVRTAFIGVDNLTLADSGNSGNSVVYRASSTSGGEVLHARNIMFGSTANWTTIAGNINTTVYSVPPTRNYTELNTSNSAQSAGAMFSDLGVIAPASSSVYPINLRQGAESYSRLAIRSDGQLELGGGAGATDVVLARSAADTLRLATGDKLIPQTTGQELGGASNQWRVYHEIVATAALPAAGSTMNGAVIIEDAGTGDRNLVFYAGGQRFRVDGGAAF